MGNHSHTNHHKGGSKLPPLVVDVAIIVSLLAGSLDIVAFIIAHFLK